MRIDDKVTYMKAILVVNLEENLLKEFKSFAAAKHGRLRNALRPEVELALKNHLSNSRKEGLDR
jgi:hypothetical protein